MFDFKRAQKRELLRFITTVLFIISATWDAFGTITLPALISDNMVLQQGQPVHIWGKAAVNENVTITILDQEQKVVADKHGSWEVWLHPMNVSESVTMTVSGANTITVKNILIGEVWFACGQSNMEWSVRKSNNSDEEIAQANYPDIRFFDAQKSFSDTV